MSTTLQDLVNRAVFLSTETQTHFGGLIAEAEWEVDFTADPHLTFTAADSAPLRTRPHLLGSESSSQGTWLWGWENINEFPEAVVGLSHDVRKFGAAEDIAELITPELDLDDELALRLTLAAKEATGKWAHYPAAAGAGTTVWLLVDSPELTLPEPQVKTSVRALMQGLTLTTVDDHRGALEAYVDKRGIPTVPLPEDGLRLLFADGSADLSFDDQRRISNCEVQAPLEGEAAEQFSRITGIRVAAPAEEVPGAGVGAGAATGAGAGAGVGAAAGAQAPTSGSADSDRSAGAEVGATAEAGTAGVPSGADAASSAAASRPETESAGVTGADRTEPTQGEPTLPQTDRPESDRSVAATSGAQAERAEDSERGAVPAEAAADRSGTDSTTGAEADATTTHPADTDATMTGASDADRAATDRLDADTAAAAGRTPAPTSARSEGTPVDDASTDTTESTDTTAEPEKKKGLFSRLFGR